MAEDMRTGQPPKGLKILAKGSGVFNMLDRCSGLGNLTTKNSTLWVKNTDDIDSDWWITEKVDKET